MLKTIRESIREALAEEMRRDGKVILIGEDIGQYGGTLQVTLGLFDEFGAERVIDTPISESSITGMATGAAMSGMRPVVELMFADFVFIAFDQIANNAAKMCYGYDGQLSVPMVIRAPFGAGTRSGKHHCQSVEALLAHIPGLKVVIPSNAYDAKGLLKSAIRDNNPVVFLEHKLLYGTRAEVPDDDYVLPLDKAGVKREGRDLTIVSWANMLPKALRAAETLAREGIEAEVIDLISAKPIDSETIVRSVTKTGRLLVAHEAVLAGGLGAEIAAIVAREAFGYLDAPIERVGAPDTPPPFSPALEDAFIPGEDDILEKARGMF